ncbi:uncharacterized protein MONOS_13197 [Monocercomonoides exilis]|uniref:uncharacterized protein n=1 Tax=Monocercomonoides exilis TaxID=2049356 RepID=UPI003559DDAD|nr:hypothetical protein MONOS_13197 [Monocercomonoides exilis]|eukprot:MONOS_13197.1-p1 / transcript=MONOS_13197.1 / gene=MONOS_13197 / organism=Monocercomonoides_exilis_PA203 / gene_product=unspecified product / transcript_product=unspecified product / location=Mono_scaffold00789:13390-14956(-) / protein_length=437 / sequence_SO=supercontig / SO=protein_coding / is_pseudo=false
MQTQEETQLNHISKRVIELFSELEDCTEIDRKQKIEELHVIIDGMVEEEFKSVFMIEMYDNIHNMVEEKKISLENAFILLKHIGYCKVMKNVWYLHFEESPLSKRLVKMIEDGNEKNERMNENFLANLCECYLLLNDRFDSELFSVCIPSLLKVASNKEESEETQEEKEIALLALSNIYERYFFVDKKLYLNEIQEIILYHQEHHNLTRLAYQSAWHFLYCRFCRDESLKDIVVGELHFAREARRELEELSKCIDWKRKGGEEGEKERKEMVIIIRWLTILGSYFFSYGLRNEEHFGLIGSIMGVLRASKENYKRIYKKCIDSLSTAARNRALKVDDFLSSGAADFVLEVVAQSHVFDEQTSDCLNFFKILCERLRSEREIESDKAKRKELKRKVLDKLEEEGYEDCIIGLHCCKFEDPIFDLYLVPDFDDYLVYC